MSSRSSHTVQTRVEKKVFSQRQVHRKRQKSVPSRSPSQSQSQDYIQQQRKEYNFNSGYNIKPAQLSSSSRQSQSSENQTENFIRAQFKPSLHNKLQDFKLFSNETKIPIKQKQPQSKVNLNSSNEQRIKRQTYDTAYFQISIQDQQSNKSAKYYELFSQKISPTELISNQIKPINKHHNKSDHKQQIHLFSQLQDVENAIMKALKQKQKHVELLIKQLENLNEQKMHSFKINNQLQLLLKTLITKNKQNKVENKDWRPKTVEEMKLQMENQLLTDELKILQDEQQRVKQLQHQLNQQQKVLKQSLKSTLKTRKQYAKILINPSHHAKQPFYHSKNQQKSTNQKTINPKRNEHSTVISNSIKGPKSKTKNNQNDLNQLREKQLLLKLLNDFNQLRVKIDQSLVNQQKQRSITFKKKQTGKKHIRNAVNK